MNRTTLGIVLVAAIVLFVGAAVFMNRDADVTNEDTVFIAPTDDPIDVSTEFAGAWLRNLQATTAVAMPDFLAEQPTVADDLKETLLARVAVRGAVDPILCQETVPERVGGKSVYTNPDSAQVIVLARGGEKTPQQAIVTLSAVDGQWQITNLTCSNGEMGGPVGEFTFEQKGRLVRESVPAPYNTDTWHVIFSQEDDSVGIVPLAFDEASQCMQGDNSTACDTGNLQEGTTVIVRANMTEAGAQVKQLELE